MAPIRVAVQVTSSGGADSSLSRGAQHAIAQGASEYFELIWLPPRVSYRPHQANAWVDSAMYLFVTGFALGSLVKPFIESIMQEAGKDFWNQVKKLIVRLRKSQAEETYRVAGKTYIVFELGEEFVLIELHTSATANDPASLSALDEDLSKQLEALVADWAEIGETIQQFALGRHREYVSVQTFDEKQKQENRVHVISLGKGHFSINPEPASRHFGSGDRWS